jgi:hypothetical protein
VLLHKLSKGLLAQLKLAFHGLELVLLVLDISGGGASALKSGAFLLEKGFLPLVKKALFESDACRTRSLTGTPSIKYSRRMFPFCSGVKVGRVLSLSACMFEPIL